MSQLELIESLLARVNTLETRSLCALSLVKALEARINDLCPPPNPSAVAPEGMPSFNVKKRIESLESQFSVSTK